MKTIVASMDAWPDKLIELGFIPPAEWKEKGCIATTAALHGKTDASYKQVTFADGTKCLFLYNFRSGESFQIVTKALRKNGAARKEADSAVQEFSDDTLAEQKKAAEIAQAEYAMAKVADQNHPYLKKKQVEAGEDLRQDVHGNLLIPIRDMSGDITSLEKFTPEGARPSGVKKMDCVTTF